MTVKPYPVRIQAPDEIVVSRWLWFVKWVLAIPHYVILSFLWFGAVVVFVVAFVAILVTGRYPRSLFDYTVGVLRWSWRVHFYAYTVLGTDRYPPFTLADDPGYPARLEVDYPERLSRGLALVKWWLLAIPHYIVVAILVGGGSGWSDDEANTRVNSPGLIGILVLIAAIVLLFTSRYPPALYRLVVALNRWVYRVCGYALLLTDEYPPFRLDVDPEPVPRTPGPAPQGPEPDAQGHLHSHGGGAG